MIISYGGSTEIIQFFCHCIWFSSLLILCSLSLCVPSLSLCSLSLSVFPLSLSLPILSGSLSFSSSLSHRNLFVISQSSNR